MATTQSEDPNERVNHPRHYNQHPSNVECVELIEHLPSNLANAIKYIWRCGLKTSEEPLRDLQSALWYTVRESDRVRLFEIDTYPASPTDIIWRALARRILEGRHEHGVLEEYLGALLNCDLALMQYTVEKAIRRIDAKKETT